MGFLTSYLLGGLELCLLVCFTISPSNCGVSPLIFLEENGTVVSVGVQYFLCFPSHPIGEVVWGLLGSPTSGW